MIYSLNLNQVGLPPSTIEFFHKGEEIEVSPAVFLSLNHLFHFNYGLTGEHLVLSEPGIEQKAFDAQNKVLVESSSSIHPPTPPPPHLSTLPRPLQKKSCRHRADRLTK